MIICPFSSVLPENINSSLSVYISIKVFGKVSSVEISDFVNSNIFAFYTNIDGDPMWEEHPGKYNPSNTPKQ